MTTGYLLLGQVKQFYLIQYKTKKTETLFQYNRKREDLDSKVTPNLEDFLTCSAIQIIEQAQEEETNRLKCFNRLLSIPKQDIQEHVKPIPTIYAHAFLGYIDDLIGSNLTFESNKKKVEEELIYL
ncbi:MAG: hypothetical protein ACMXYK_00980 [Candidatus Woesearchaeota archaeon]